MTSDKPFDDRALAENMIAALSPTRREAMPERGDPPATQPESDAQAFVVRPVDDGVPLSFGFLSEDGLERYFAPSAEARPEMPITAPPPGFAPSLEETDWAETGVNLPFCEFLAYKAALAYADWPTDGEGEKIVGKPEAHPIKRVLDQCSASIENFAFFETPEKLRKDGVSDTQGYGFTMDGVVYVIMRGTESDLDWKGNADADVTVEEPPRSPAFLRDEYHRLLHAPGQHEGFARGWSTVRRQIDEWIRSLPWPVGGKRRIVLAGHSLGGALAKIGAFEFETKAYHDDRQVVAVVTFGAPMVGSASFKEQYDQALGGRTVRMEAAGDIVPLIMGRWYYRMNRGMARWFDRRMRRKVDLDGPRSPEAAPARSRFANFAPVGRPWTFKRTPVMDWLAIDTALKSIEAAARGAGARPTPKSDAGAAAEGRVDDAVLERRPDPEPEPASAEADAPASEPAETARETRADPAPKREKRQKKRQKKRDEKRPALDDEDKGGEGLYWILGVGSLVLLIAAGVYGYQLYRKFTRSHEIQRRYALYLSSLSYARLRELHPHDVEAANRALQAHLNFVRGEVTDNKHVFAPVKELPLRVRSPEDLKKVETFLNQSGQSFVV